MELRRACADLLLMIALFIVPTFTSQPCTTAPCAGGDEGCKGNLCMGDGDCDNDSDCADGLKCGTDNCADFHEAAGWPQEDGTGWDATDDCCYSPTALGAPRQHVPCGGGNNGCAGELGMGDGDCDSHTDCAVGLYCGTDNCASFREASGWPEDGPGWDTTDDCCYYPGGLGSPYSCHVPCDGGNDGCNGALGVGDGDCDDDGDCAEGLTCGTDNCDAFRSSAGWPEDAPGWDRTDDCCYYHGGLGSHGGGGGGLAVAILLSLAFGVSLGACCAVILQRRRASARGLWGTSPLSVQMLGAGINAPALSAPSPG